MLTPRAENFSTCNSSLLVWWQTESCHLDYLIPPCANISLKVEKFRECKQAVLFWNQGMLFSSLNFFTLITSASQNIKNIENQELSKANQFRCAYSETSMSIVFIPLLTPHSLITSDYIFKETSRHCKHCKKYIPLGFYFLHLAETGSPPVS